LPRAVTFVEVCEMLVFGGQEAANLTP